MLKYFDKLNETQSSLKRKFAMEAKEPILYNIRAKGNEGNHPPKVHEFQRTIPSPLLMRIFTS